MGYLGKILVGAVVGVGAVAAVPFTGGGSLLAGATLLESLTGAGLIAGAVGAGGAVAGAAAQRAENNVKEEQTKEAKASSFKDGVNEGKAQTVGELKKHVDFYLATTALSFWIARSDNNISKEEQLEIDFDLDSIKKNAEIPEPIKNEMMGIATNENISFEDVRKRLDKVSVDTLKNLACDVDEIIQASDGILPEEQAAKDKFISYLEGRIANE